jgi:YYY domain-containing protein
MIDTLSFWLLVQAVGLVGLPFASALFGRLPGGGLALARPLGLLLVAYPVWLLASLHAVPYGRWSAVAASALTAAIAVRLLLSCPSLRPRRGSTLRLWLTGELLFAVAFLLWSLLRSFSPEVLETEKPMDMAIVNSINRSDSLPPHDPWLSGERLNYHYFGHFLSAFLIRILGVDPAVGYNLAVALFLALSATTVFAVASALYLALRPNGRRSGLAGLGAAGLALAGNAAGGVQYLQNPGPFDGYNWFSPSRVITGTANEFPFFSFLLGDLHAHMVAAPFALTALAFTMQLCLCGPLLPRRGESASWWRAAGFLGLGALLLGSLYALNTLDYPTAAALGVLGLLLWTLEVPGTWRPAATWAVLWLAASVLLMLPFWLRYSPESAGIGLVGERTHFSTFLKDEFLIYGVLLWILATAFVPVFAVPFRYLVWGGVGIGVALVLLSPSRLASVTLALSLAAFALYLSLAGERPQPVRLLWLLISAGLTLVGIGEFVYVRDAFDGTPSFRFNTVFKVGYQAWFLLSVSAGCIALLNGEWLGRRLRAVWGFGLAGLLVLAVAYPIVGSWSRAGGFAHRPTLDGMAWLKRRAPGDAAAIAWLRTAVRGRPTVLEAVGPDFDPEGSGRVSTFTGLPTVLGWEGHEFQWGHDPGRRRSDVRRIYSTRDVADARTLLAKYGVRYVFVGSLERRDYPPASLAKFARLGAPVFRAGKTMVFRVRSEPAYAPSAERSRRCAFAPLPAAR